MSDKGTEKASALAWVERNRGPLSEFHQKVWGYAEPAWREYRSAGAYVERLREEGFTVEVGSGGMPTAFLATWGEGRPVLGSFAEYDAVPGNSQQAVPQPAPREGLSPWAPGHTDPHSSLGVGALAGILAAKHAMQMHNLRGTLRFFGEPAEKVCGSKPVHAAKGYYDGADAYVVYHPHMTNTVLWDTHCGSYWSCVFTFEGTDPEPWVDPDLLAYPGHPHASPRSPGAIDALCLMYTMTKYTKENMYPHTGTWTMNEAILVGGQCTSDNLSPRVSQIQYAWRSPTLAIQKQLFRVLENNAKQAARAANCRAYVRWVTKTRVGLPNHVMAEAVYANLEQVGPPKLGEEARRFGRDIQASLGLPQTEDPFTEDCQVLRAPQDYEAERREGLPPWQRNFTSDDYVEYTWHAPTARLYTGRPVLRQGSEWSHWSFNALGGFAPAIDPSWQIAGKVIGATLIDLITQPEILSRAREEFAARTGGGMGGDAWVPPLLPADFSPPVDLRWPEYVRTARGEGWWIPTEADHGEPLA
jgi:aminobenzoyl-glutamate utilization protein B